MSLRKRNYLQGLDGLRALAIAGITAFHMAPDFVPGGYMGVVLFFLLTGFLLSYTGFSSWQNKAHFDLFGYYVKRVKRIYPELLIMLLTSIGVLYWLVPNAIAAIRPEAISVLLGYNNWWQIDQSMDYFTRMLNASPFAHLWFLGVELQYYLLWPILFGISVILWEILGLRWAAGFMALLAAFSSGLMPYLYGSGGDITRLYYGTDTRVHTLLWGAVLGMLAFKTDSHNDFKIKMTSPVSVLKYLIAFLAVIVTLGAYAFLSGETPLVYQGGMLYMTLVFMVLLQLAVDRDFAFGRWLDNPLCKWIGKHSYGIFLWQYPVIYLSEHFGYVNDIVYYFGQLLVIILLTLWGERAADYLLHPHFFHMVSKIQAARVLVLACLSLAGTFFMGTGCYGIAMSADARSSIQQALEKRLAHETDELAKEQEIAEQPAPTAVQDKPIKKKVNLNNIACIGDSVLLGAGSQLRDMLPGCRIDAKVSRYVSDGADVAESWQSQGLIGEIVVVALGTNGPIAAGERYEVQARRLLNALGPNCHIFWVNTHAPHLKWQNSNNEYLQQLSQTHANVTIVDWHSAASQHPEWLVKDGVHPSDEGAKAFAKLVKDTIISTMEK